MDSLADNAGFLLSRVGTAVQAGFKEVLAGWQEKYPDVEVHRGVVRDHPVNALVSASAGQDLVVVGSHSRHARIAALLGYAFRSRLRLAR